MGSETLHLSWHFAKQAVALFPCQIIAKQAVSQFDQDHMLLSNSGEFTKQVVSQTQVSHINNKGYSLLSKACPYKN
jgi:hypothetical protein